MGQSDEHWGSAKNAMTHPCNKAGSQRPSNRCVQAAFFEKVGSTPRRCESCQTWRLGDFALAYAFAIVVEAMEKDKRNAVALLEDG